MEQRRVAGGAQGPVKELLRVSKAEISDDEATRDCKDMKRGEGKRGEGQSR